MEVLCDALAMAYRGGVDKRCMADGGETIHRKIECIAPVVRDGGNIPSCDHGVPPDVSWPGLCDYARPLASIAGWA